MQTFPSSSVQINQRNESLLVLARTIYADCQKTYKNEQRSNLLLGACLYIQAVFLCNIFLYFVSTNTSYECASQKTGYM
jgi:hypothetical protein